MIIIEIKTITSMLGILILVAIESELTHGNESHLAAAETLNTNNARQAFEEQYPDALRKIEDYFSTAKATGRLTINTSGRVKRVEEYFLDYQYSDGASKYMIRDEMTGAETVVCRNPEKYLFFLKRTSSDTDFFRTSIQPKDAELSDSQERYMYRCMNASHAVYGVPISFFMKDPSFKVMECSFVDKDGRKLLRVSYKLAPEGYLMLRDGELWLSPDEGWALREYSSSFGFYNSGSDLHKGIGIIEYKAGDDNGVKTPKHVVFEQRFGQGMVRHEEYRAESVEQATATPDEFTLTHYDLPEVVGEIKPIASLDPITAAANRSRRRPFSSWLIVLNVVLIAMVVGLHQYKKRKRQL